MGWTGVLDEEAFKALHDLKDGKAPTLHGADVEVAGTGAYLSLPPGGTPPFAGGVVLIHEWWGLNAHVKHWADRLAADGFAALAVDLYGGKVATNRDEAMAAMQAVDETAALATLRAAHDFLRGDERVRAAKVASMGWCFGGDWSLRLAIAEPRLDAAVIYYGRLVDDPAQLASIEAPVLGVFGDRDTGIPPEAVDAFAAAMQSAGKSLELHRYDAEHAFANPSGQRYDTVHAEAAWQRVRRFLRAELEPQGALHDGSRKLGWTLPPGWRVDAAPKPMRLATMQVGEGEQTSECTLVVLPGEAGGPVANINRWRNQMGQAPLSAGEIAKLPKVDVLGRESLRVEIRGAYRGMSGETIDDAMMVAALCALDGETLFVKLTGPRAIVEAEAARFDEFCRSLR